MYIESETLACITFQREVPGLVDTGADPFLHPHAQACAQCRGLLEDIERISQLAGHSPLRDD